LISSLLSPNLQSFIEEHQHDDPNDIYLKYESIFGLPTSVVVNQITGRKKSKEKLPTWFNTKQILFPPAINIEQASSERAAELKIGKIREELGTFAPGKILDLTGGFGVDSYFFSQVFDQVTLVEPNPQLLEIVKHNFQILEVTNVNFHNATAEEFLPSLVPEHSYDLIYVDPSRRLKDNRKVFSFNQCEPDVIKLLPKLFQISSRILVKASPLLDITLGLRELREVRKVIVTAIDNECKELLFFCHQGIKQEPMIEAINLSSSETNTFSFFPSDESSSKVEYGDPLSFLYEPYASVLKSGAFKLISSRFKCHKLQPNTHLYTSNQLVKTFPGRIFQIESFVKPDSKTLKNFFSDSKGNVVVRNYPLTVDELRKRTGLRDGGEKFLIGCSGVNKKFLIVASRLK
jgi:hypothetical protein